MSTATPIDHSTALLADWFSSFNLLARVPNTPIPLPPNLRTLDYSKTRPLNPLDNSVGRKILDILRSVNEHNEKGISLANQGITVLPEQFGQLTSLETVFLNGNKLETLPESISSLTNLSMLFAHDNCLKTLPKTLSNLSSLRYLDLHNNQLEELPENFGEKLFACSELILFKNSLQTLPRSIINLKNVVRLELQHNQLDTLPEEIHQLVSLEVLNLAHNQIFELPESLGGNINLLRLDLSFNKLSTLPSSFDQLKKLQSLWIDSNMLNHVPASILSMESLNLLSLRNNSIGPSLPRELSKLSKLTFFWLNNNSIELLPPEIASMQNLQDLYLTNNPCFRIVSTNDDGSNNDNHGSVVYPTEDSEYLRVMIKSNRRFLPSLQAICAKALLRAARIESQKESISRERLISYIKGPIPWNVLEILDSLEDCCTECQDPCWESGKDLIYDEEWYPGQFVRIGWRKCWFCCTEK